jgi:hypothetical protein
VPLNPRIQCQLIRHKSHWWKERIVPGTDPPGADFSRVGGNREESNDEEEHDLPVVRP